MSIKARIEAIIYAAEEPITLEQIVALVKDDVRQELLTREQSASLAETPEAGVVPAEDDREANLAAAPAEAAAAEQEPAPKSISDGELKAAVRAAIDDLIGGYNSPDHGIEIRQVAGGFRMATKPEQHDVVRAFAKSLKPPIRLSLQALETLAVIAYKQPITAPEIGDIRGVDCSGVLGTLLERKLITTAGRKQVIGRPILYKTTKEFLLRFGLKDVSELPSMEEFEKLATESLGADLFPDTSETTAPAGSENGDPTQQESATQLEPAEPEGDTHAADTPADHES